MATSLLAKRCQTHFGQMNEPNTEVVCYWGVVD